MYPLLFMKFTAMKNEDQLIKELLQEGFVEKAPEGFTQKVMQAVAVAETEKQSAFQWNKLVYPALIFGSISLVFALLVYESPSFYSRLYTSLSGYVLMLGSQLSSIFASVTRPEMPFQINWFVVEIAVAIVVLVAMEKFIFLKGRTMNLFVI